eukprot:213652-Chlamydomonas_euryale.AAC.1
MVRREGGGTGASDGGQHGAMRWPGPRLRWRARLGGRVPRCGTLAHAIFCVAHCVWTSRRGGAALEEGACMHGQTCSTEGGCMHACMHAWADMPHRARSGTARVAECVL